ncbi:MAG: tRNA (N6-isopentenyl adenosine(37)-C2)-methylthiotransferase MiaB [Ignavibacteriales bacterium]|nr:tRNA (N6-isopentenyl adenosine(37)-C2)-methylthiotransferase MiaB [Ignavibacteriales bacterium]
MNKQVYIETYGCQMNLADSEVVLSIMHDNQYSITGSPETADVILVNTCSVRDNAEQRVRQRLHTLKKYKRENPGVLIGVLGCMAERLRTELIEKGNVVDLVVGPDEYRKLPSLVENAFNGQKGIAVQLSRVENYDDIEPLRTEGISAWLSVMRGCDKFCSFCVVPFTRGRERSRSLRSIVAEVERLSARNFKEVTLLGQNVNSYVDGAHDFADVLTAVSGVHRSMRVRFMTSHPQDMSGRLIRAIADNPNVCSYIHLPVQSGSDRILQAMNRSYTSIEYLDLVQRIREAIPDVSLSTDIIAGFPGETDDDHRRTLSLMQEATYDGAFMFKYSPREHTKAWDMADDVPEGLKIERLNEIIELQQSISLQRNQLLVNQTVDVLIERDSAKSNQEWMGRTDTNKTVVFPKTGEAVGNCVRVTINRCNAATLFGTRAMDEYRMAVNQ